MHSSAGCSPLTGQHYHEAAPRRETCRSSQSTLRGWPGSVGRARRRKPPCRVQQPFDDIQQRRLRSRSACNDCQAALLDHVPAATGKDSATSASPSSDVDLDRGSFTLYIVYDKLLSSLSLSLSLYLSISLSFSLSLSVLCKPSLSSSVANKPTMKKKKKCKRLRVAIATGRAQNCHGQLHFKVRSTNFFLGAAILLNVQYQTAVRPSTQSPACMHAHRPAAFFHFSKAVETVKNLSSLAPLP